MNKKIIIGVIVVLVIVAIVLPFLRPHEQKLQNRPYIISASSTPATVSIKMTADGFSPSEVTIKVGQSVEFVNAVGASCNPQSPDCEFWPASNPHPTHEIYPEFDPREPVAFGQAWSFTFDRVGNWGFHDHFHFTNRGTVHVTE